MDLLSTDLLTGRIIGCALEVHRFLGPGLLESAYSQCFAYELSAAGMAFEIEKPMPVRYKDITLDCGYRVDFLVEKQVIVELKAVSEVVDIHKAQTLSYMKLASVDTGLLINFNVKLLKNGITRFKL
ncbi:MAG: GxxExxY protein [Desulfosalsimonadaceae bacterium]